MDDLKQQLIDRLNKNLSDYHAHLIGFGKQEIIDMVSRAAAMSDVHMYLTTQYAFNEGEIEYLLNFQNPLEVVTDAWEIRIADLSDLSFTMQSVCDHQDALQDYPLMSDAPAQEDTGREQRENPDRSDVSGQTRDGAEKVHGYEIKQSVVFTNDRGFAMAENPNAPQPFVTWQFTEENGKRDYYWGHYFGSIEKAAGDFADRISDYREQYKVEEKKPSLMERLKAAKQAVQPEVKPKAPGVSKDEPR